MKGAELLETLLARIADSSDGIVYITEAELACWPDGPVSVLKASGLLVAASPARSATCDGCGHRCSMSVEVIDYPGSKGAFIFCDKRDDIDRIEVEFDRLQRWQASGEAVAAFLADSLGVGRLHGIPVSENEWPVGRFRAGRAENVVLEKRRELIVCVAGHAIPLIEIAVLESDGLKVQRERLVDAVAHPAVGGGKREPRPERAARLAHRFDELKAAGFPAPRQILAADENVKVETIKKLLTEGRERIRRHGPEKS